MVDFINALRDPQFRADYLRGLKDAGNRSAAAFFGGPVDFATMAMRPFGYSTQDSDVIGGSEWIGRKMEEHGMVSEARNPIAEFLASIAIPSAVAAQAPRIFAAEQAAIKNAAAPSTGNYQRGALFITDGLENRGRDLIQSEAKRLASMLEDKGFKATLEHSGSAAGPSSYIKVSDPETGRFFTKDIRLSGHQKGVFNSQSVWDVNSGDFDDVMKSADEMRGMGKSKFVLMQEKRDELISMGVKPKQAYKQAMEMFGLNK